ncbi:ANTAR domain-containing response regulator [Streptomyces griseus]|uniref:ANTAR domain-containing response regulator n=1 Tax=Streptomyces griseus TaxID=1911 RepID=UPI00055BD6B6|nr:ANTAR domain-containing protein [Streptomyces griseus]
MTSVTPPSLAGGMLGTLVIDGYADQGRAQLAAHGELVHGCADVLDKALAELSADARRVELDMSGVTFMDTAGLQFLELLEDYGRRTGVAVATAGWSGQPRRILELMGMEPVLGRIEADEPLPVSSVVALERAERLTVLQEEIEQLRHAISSRPVIDQARGILMAVHACTSGQAWHILRETSQHTNTKLRTVAEAITSSVDGPAPPEELREALRAAIARHTDRVPS